MNNSWKNARENFRVFFFYLRKYKRYYAIGIFSLIVVDCLEVAPPLLLKKAVDELAESNPIQKVFLWLAAAYVGVAIIQGFMRYLWRQYIIRTSMIAANDMRQDLFQHLSILSPGFFKKNRVGELVSLSTNDIESVRFALGPGALTFFDALFYFIAIPPIMFYLSPKLTLLSLAPMILLPYFVRKMEARIHKHFTTVQNRFSDLASHCQESLGGMRLIKGGSLEIFKEREFSSLGQRYAQANLNAVAAQATLSTVLEVFVSICLTLFFVVGGAFVIEEKVTLGIFVAFQRYIQKMSWPMEAIGLAANILQRSFASQKRIDRVLLTEAGILDAKQAAKNSANAEAKAELQVTNLRFQYPGSAHPALINANFSVAPGKKIGIIGSVGSGKSTLLACLARMEAVSPGMIFLHNTDVTALSRAAIRSRIGLVPQEVFLFSRTVEENILYGSEYLSAKPEIRLAQARQAAKQAQVLNEIEKLPKGFSTILGERGVNLSGGQKQRITIARALARNPEILLFDDCLSAVDAETEMALIDSLSAAGTGRSILFSTHRLSSLSRMDTVIVLHKGEQIFAGDPREALSHYPLLTPGAQANALA